MADKKVNKEEPKDDQKQGSRGGVYDKSKGSSPASPGGIASGGRTGKKSSTSGGSSDSKPSVR